MRYLSRDKGGQARQEWLDAETGRDAAVLPKQFLDAVLRRGWVVAASVAACFAIGVLFAINIAPQYTSTAQIILDPRDLQGVNNGARPRNDSADATEAAIGNEMQVLKSTTLLLALVDKDDLAHAGEFAARPTLLGRLLAGLSGGARPSQAASNESDVKLAAMRRLQSVIAVQRTERSFVVDVSVRTSDSELSAKLANDLVDLYIAQSIAGSASLNQRLSDALQNRLSDLRRRVEIANGRVEKFRKENRLVSAGGVLTSELRLRSLTDELAAAQAREEQDHSRADAISKLDGGAALDAVPEAAASPVVAQLRAQLAEQVTRRSAVARQLGPRHPEMIAADEQVRAVQALLDQQLKRLGKTAQSQYSLSKQNARTLQREANTLSESTLNDNSATSQLRQLEQEAEATRALLTAFIARSRELSEQTEIHTSNVRQIGVALPALSRSNTSMSVVLAFSILVGLVLGSLLAALMERFGDWRRQPGAGARAFRTA